MNDRITDLLDEVADDDGRPLGFTVADVTARGAAVRRRRQVTGAALGLAAAAAVAVAVAVVAPSDTASEPPPAAPTTATDVPTTTAPTSDAATTAPPVLGGRDAEVLAECSAVDGWLDEWILDAQVTDADGTTASFVSPQGDRYRTCQLGAAGDELSGPFPINPGETLLGTVRGTAPNFASLCPKDGPGSCSARLYYAALPLPEGVASIDVETPAGRTISTTTGRLTYVLRFVESGEADPVPPIVATFRDGEGEVLLELDYNEVFR